MGYKEEWDKAYESCVYDDFEKLESFMRDVFINIGMSEEDSKVTAKILIESDKRGIDSHGIGRLQPIYINRIDQKIINTKTEYTIEKETETTCVIDGHNSMGHPISYLAMNKAIEKAKKYGMGMSVVRNSNHYGIAGYYTTMAAENNMIGATGTNARPSIAPTFGVENMLGTNPFTWEVPSDEPFNFLLDAATSTSQRGKIEVYGRAEKELPEGWVIGRDGKSRTDTNQILEDLTQGKAALTPLGGVGESNGGYKGYGYATLVEILSAALQNGKYLKDLSGIDENGNLKPYPLGHFFIAINVENFIDPAIFKSIVGSISRQLRASQKAEGAERIYTPGEKEYLALQYRNERGGVPVPSVLRDQLTALRDRFSLDYKFNWD